MLWLMILVDSNRRCSTASTTTCRVVLLTDDEVSPRASKTADELLLTDRSTVGDQIELSLTMTIMTCQRSAFSSTLRQTLIITNRLRRKSRRPNESLVVSNVELSYKTLS